MDVGQARRSVKRDPAAKVDLDLALVRKNLVRLAIVQLALLVAVVFVLLFLTPPGGSVLPMLWTALLPVIVALWALVYWRALNRAKAADGGTFGSYQKANSTSLRALGLLAVAWGVGLALALIFG